MDNIQTTNLVENSSSVNSTSFFSKILKYKYLIILIILLISLTILYYKFKNKNKKNKNEPESNSNQKTKLQEFVVADINGKVIKILGEQIGELKLPQNQATQNSTNQKQYKNNQHIIQEDTSDENNNTKQHDLTVSEIRDITSKLKN